MRRVVRKDRKERRRQQQAKSEGEQQQQRTSDDDPANRHRSGGERAQALASMLSIGVEVHKVVQNVDR